MENNCSVSHFGALIFVKMHNLKRSERESTTIVQLVVSHNESSVSNELTKFSCDNIRDDSSFNLFKEFPAKYIMLHGVVVLMATVALFCLQWHQLPYENEDYMDKTSFSAAVKFSSIFFTALGVFSLYLGKIQWKNKR